jgi:serine/threonine-protein kinase
MTAGTRLGPYEILAPIGAGGMGEVYSARDTRLGRDVAIKISSENFSDRFEREARSIAALNHPNICHLYDVGPNYLVMELIEGERLRGPLPIDQALNYARQIADALEAAHERGVIHRDLKPDNILITPSGVVKVLDFGLAKAADAAGASGDPANSPTITMSPTRAGMILGTAAYMAPEQARGKPVDHRADVWAFGVVLYEMLTGKQIFTGETITDVLASVVKEQPVLHELPAPLRMIVERCLQKDPRQRWQAIADIRVLIEGLLADPRKILEAEQRNDTQPLWKRAIPVGVTAILACAIASGVTFWALRHAPPSVVRFSVPLGQGQVFTNTGRRDIAISPDGTEMVYIANGQLYLRRMAELEARPIPGSQDPMGITNIVFAPEGRSIAYWVYSEHALKRIGLAAGGAVTICRVAQNPAGMSWDTSGIVFAQASQGIFRVSANGGKPELLSAVKKDETVGFPQILPGGQAVMFSTWHGTDADSEQVVAETLKSNSRKVLIPEGGAARYVPTGHLVYALAGSLYAAPFDVRRLEVSGAAVPVVEGVKRGLTRATSDVAQFDFSSDGSLIYIPGPAMPLLRQYSLGLFTPNGNVETLKLPPGGYGFPRVTRDGKRVAYEVDDSGSKTADIWIYDLSETNAPRRLTFQGANRYPVWSADGERVAFQSDREGDLAIFWQRADGAGTAERLTRPEKEVAHIPDSFSPDGQQLSFTAHASNNPSSVWILSLRDRKATLFADGGSGLAEDSTFSPDGRWLAYSIDTPTGGGDMLYVQAFPPAPGKYQIAQGHAAFWSSDGKQLTFDAGPRQYATVKVTTTGGFAFSSPTVFPGRLVGGPSGPRRYDVLPDGRIIGAVNADSTQTDAPAAAQIQVVLNWFEELKQRVPAR